VAVAIKVVGALLITAMLLIPAAAARPLASTPERMVGIALIIGAFSSLVGLILAYYGDSPAAPTMVSVAAFLFGLTNLLARLLKARRRG